MTARRLMLGAGVAIIVAIWVLSLMPSPPYVPGGDKWHHGVAYAGCTLWWCLALATWRQRRIAMIALVGMGAVIEVLQGASGYRYFELADIAANTAGVLCGAILATLLPLSPRASLR